MILTLWKNTREAYHGAIEAWIAEDYSGAILLLRSAIKYSETLIIYLEKKG
jgi:hypothetical protein